MNNSFAIVVDKKENFQSIINDSINHFGGDIQRITKQNYILTQNEYEFVIDIKPQIIKCFVFSEESDSISNEIKEFYRKFDRDGQVGTYYF